MVLATGAYPCKRTTPVSNVEMVTQADAIVRVIAVGPNGYQAVVYPSGWRCRGFSPITIR